MAMIRHLGCAINWSHSNLNIVIGRVAVDSPRFANVSYCSKCGLSDNAALMSYLVAEKAQVGRLSGV